MYVSVLYLCMYVCMLCMSHSHLYSLNIITIPNACISGSRGGLGALSTYGLSDRMYVCGNPGGIHSFFSWLQLRGISVRAVQVTVDVRDHLSVLQRVSHLTLMWSHVTRQIVRCNRRTLRSLHIVANIMYVCR